MAAIVLSRVESFKLGAYGASEASSTDAGSCRTLELNVTVEENVGTSAAFGDAIVEALFSGTRASVKVELEDITLDNLAKTIGGTVSGSDILLDGIGGTPTYFTLYARGFKADGTAKYLHGVKCYIKPNSGIKLGKDQQVLSLEIVLMCDPASALGYKTLKFATATVDTTPPTISSVSPADAATAVAKAVTTLVVWTFSEAIRNEDVNAAHFFVHQDDGTLKAGTLALGTNYTVVTFTPSALWAATTKFHAVVIGGTGGVRDTAGNALAATSVTDFTTGS